MSGLLVFSEELTNYDFGPDHPMAPGRVKNTISLARQLGVLDRLTVVPPPEIDLALLETVHTAEYIAAVQRGEPSARHGLGTSDNPIFPGMHDDLGLGWPWPVSRRPGGSGRRGAAGQQRQRRPAPRDARPDQRVLRLQRHRGGHPLAAGQRLRAGRLRRRRRAPRRRRAGDLLRRPAGDDGQPARDAGVPVPRHRVSPPRPAARGRRAPRSTWRCRPAPPTPAGCGRSTPSCRTCCAPSSPPCWSPSTAATRTGTIRWPISTSPSTGSARRTWRWPTWPTSCAGALGVHRRRRLRGAQCRAAGLDPSAGHRQRAAGRPRTPGPGGVAGRDRRMGAADHVGRSRYRLRRLRGRILARRAGSIRPSWPPARRCSPSSGSTRRSERVQLQRA